MAISAEARQLFEDTLELLEPYGDVTGKSMFGGFGYWERGDMFAMISSDGNLYFKVDDATVARYRKARASQFAPHMRNADGPMPMPYWTVPKAVLADETRLAEWVTEAIAVGHATSKKKPAKKASKPRARTP